MKEFSEQASAFRDAYDAWLELDDLRRQQPELADIAEEGQHNAHERMLALELAASPELEAAAVPADNSELALLRREIENLRTTKAYQKKFISEAAIQTKLEALPRPESFSDDDINFAKAYWIGKLLRFSFNFAPTAGHTDQGNTPGPIEAGSPDNTQELLKPTLKVTFYQEDGVLAVGESAISLNPNLDTVARNPEEQALIQAHRLAIFICLSNNPDKTYSSRELWEAAELPRNLFDSSYFNQYIASFIQNDLRINNEPIFTIHKPSPDARRKYYINEKYQIELSFSPEASDIESLSDERREEAKTEEQSPQLSLHDAAILAEYINLRAPLLRQLGLQQLDDYILARFDQNIPDINKPVDKQQLAIQRARTYSFIQDCLSPGCINSLLDEFGAEDPRSDLLIYMYSMVQSQESRVLFERALRAQIVSVVRQESSRRGSNSSLDAVRYEFNDGTPTIEIPYSFIGAGASAADSILTPDSAPAENDTPGELARKPAARRRDRIKAVTLPAFKETRPKESQPADQASKKRAQEVRRKLEPAWEKEFKQKIGAVIDQLAAEDLMQEGVVPPTTVQMKSSSSMLGTRTSLLRIQQAGILPKYKGDYRAVELDPTDIVLMALFNTSPRELGKGMPRQKRSLELIKSSVDSYFEHRKQSE